MTTISKKKLTDEKIANLANSYINSRLPTCKKHLIIYLSILIISSIFLLFKVFKVLNISLAFVVLMILCLALIYDTVKEILSLYNSLKNNCEYTSLSGTLKKRAKGKTFLLDNTRLNFIDSFDTNLLLPYLDKSITCYVIGKHTFLIVT